MAARAQLWEEQEERLVRFLLGDVSPAEHTEIEDRLFTDSAFLDELLVLSDDLSDAYLAGALSPEDKARFETHFLASPLRRERFAFVRDVVSAVDAPAGSAPKSAAPRRALFWALAAAAILAVVGAAMSLLPRVQPPPRVVSTSPAPSVPHPQDPVPSTTPGQTVPSSADRATRVVRLPRGTSTRRVDIPLSARIQTVRLEIPVEPTGPSTYDAVLRSADGREVWRAEDLAPLRDGDPLVARVPADLLQGDEYQLSLEGEVIRNDTGERTVSLQFSLHVVRER